MFMLKSHFAYTEPKVCSSKHVAGRIMNQVVMHAGILLVTFSLITTLQVNAAPYEPANLNSNYQQVNILVKGRIVDSKGSPLAAANVNVKGSNTGTTSNDNGEFAVNVPNSNAILVISHIGYNSQEIAVKNRTSVNISLEESNTALSDVVVVGYGTQKKIDLTGSISTVTAKQFEARPVTNVAAALQGTMAGVTVVQGSGQPGKDQGVINVRGVGTLGNSSAMVIVDGVISTMNDVNPNDIESVTVLKDAASASIYGSRAANGVILITTKQGKSGKPVVHYNAYAGKQKPTRLPDYLPSWQSQSLYNEGLVNEGSPKLYTDEEIKKFKDGSDPDNYANTDWLKLLYRGSGIQQSHYADISGGTEKTQTFLSLGYFSQDGVVENSGLNRYSTRFRITSTLNSRITVNGNIAFTREDFKEPNSPGQEGSFGELIDGVYGISNIIPYKYSNGYYGISSTGGNPIAFLETGSQSRNVASHLRSNINADVEIIKGLHFKPLLGYLLSLNESRSFIKDIQFYDWTNGEPTLYLGPNSLTSAVDNTNVITAQALLQYDKTLGKHNLSVLGGYSQEYTKYSFLNGFRNSFLNNSLSELNAGPATGQKTSGTSSELALQSVFGRVNYAYNDKYLIEGTLRYDGSSRFSPGLRWGVYPSISAGWRVSEEPFFQPLSSTVSDLKIRASWGLLGNQDILEGNYYPYVTTISGSQDYSFAGSLAPGVAPTSGANEQIHWEDVESKDLGLDATFLNGKITLTADYFIRNTKNMLLEFPVGAIFGFRAPVVNGGSVQNKGLELAMGYRATLNDFTFNVTGNVSFIKNKVTDLKGTGPIINGFDYSFDEVGYPINSFYGYEAEGLFQTQADIDKHAEQEGGTIGPGDIMYKDKNGDGAIDDDDRGYLGTFFPEITYGLNVNMGWKGFDLTIFGQGAGGVKGFLRGELMGQLGGGKPTSIFQDHWTPENTNASFPRLWITYTQNDPAHTPSSFWIRNADYFRIKNVQLGYTISSSWLAKAHIQKARIYYSGQNVLTMTNFYKWADPETPNDGRGNRGYSYPQVKINTLGINFTF
ncbi:MAG TPA: TonB-dependent receptor [Flavitalea sp.]|nr:TonB-dependent receptor [Flavitalea sp.]